MANIDKDPSSAAPASGLNPRKLRPAEERAAALAARQNAGNVKKPQTEAIRGLGTVVIRNQFYKDGYRSMLKLVVMQGLAILLLIVALFFVVHSNKPENRYFATTEDGRLVPMVPLNQPNLSSPALMSWVAQATTEVMTFGFNDYRRRLQEASRNFTRRGWESFTQALERSRIIEMVEANQQVVTAAPAGAPILQSEGLVNGRYQWVVQIPMTISYQAGATIRSDSLLVTVVVVRVPRLESPNGVGIEQWIAVPR
jgi:intracellular multiplication protein IcmL